MEAHIATAPLLPPLCFASKTSLRSYHDLSVNTTTFFLPVGVGLVSMSTITISFNFQLSKSVVHVQATFVYC